MNINCTKVLQWLDSYIDGELTNGRLEKFHAHVAECGSCRGQLRLAEAVRQSLASRTVPDPGEDYWSEVTSLIMARTVENAEVDRALRPAGVLAADRAGLVRPLLSVAASLLILISALALGSSSQLGAAWIIQGDDAALIAASDVAGSLKTTFDPVLAEQDDLQMTRGMALMGHPRALGLIGGVPRTTGR